MKKFEDKEIQRAELKKLEGQTIFGKCQITHGSKPVGSKVRRMMLNVTIYREDGEPLNIHHLWIPMEDTKHNANIWDKLAERRRQQQFKYKFKADVVTWGIDGKAGIQINDLEKDIWIPKKLSKN